jgi:hypothetical protein
LKPDPNSQTTGHSLLLKSSVISLPWDSTIDGYYYPVVEYPDEMESDTYLATPILVISRPGGVAAISTTTEEFYIVDARVEDFLFLIEQLGEDKFLGVMDTDEIR